MTVHILRSISSRAICSSGSSACWLGHLVGVGGPGFGAGGAVVFVGISLFFCRWALAKNATARSHQPGCFFGKGY